MSDSVAAGWRPGIARRSHRGGEGGPSPVSRRRVRPQSAHAVRAAAPRRARSLRGLGRVLPVPGGGLAARLQHQLVEDVGDVALDGVRAEIERPGDQLVAVAGGDVAQHLELARAERGRGGRGAAAAALGRCCRADRAVVALPPPSPEAAPPSRSAWRSPRQAAAPASRRRRGRAGASRRPSARRRRADPRDGSRPAPPRSPLQRRRRDRGRGARARAAAAPRSSGRRR